MIGIIRDFDSRLIKRIADLRHHFFRQRKTNANSTTGVADIVIRKAAIIRIFCEQIEACGQTTVHEIGLCEIEFDPIGILAQTAGNPRILTTTQQIGFRHSHFADYTIRR